MLPSKTIRVVSCFLWSEYDSEPPQLNTSWDGVYEPKPWMAWQAYNDNLRLNTIRHAMVAQLRSPAAGFEAVVRGPPALPDSQY